MNQRSAEQHLTVIRTLMERSTIYRRALGPIFMMAGVFGIAGTAIGFLLNIQRPEDFAGLWMILALMTVSVATIMTRRQALKDKEPFWSAPTRRVAMALTPPLLVGGVLTGLYEIRPWYDDGLGLVAVWMILYGCGLHASGFITPRAVRVLGWAFLLGGTLLASTVLLCPVDFSLAVTQVAMGASFGLSHLVCGLYLRATPQGSNDT